MRRSFQQRHGRHVEKARPVAVPKASRERSKSPRAAPSHGAANLSGIEVWAGDGAIPDAPRRRSSSTRRRRSRSRFSKARSGRCWWSNCYECHSAGAKKIKGGLLLDSRAGRAARAATPGRPSRPAIPTRACSSRPCATPTRTSRCRRRRSCRRDVIADLEAWVRMGAPDPRTEDTVAAVQAKIGHRLEQGARVVVVPSARRAASRRR